MTIYNIFTLPCGQVGFLKENICNGYDKVWDVVEDSYLFILTYFFVTLLALKGIVPQKCFYSPNLIFRIVMGCGKACFSFGRGLPRTLIAGCLKLLCAGRFEIPGNEL